MNNNGLPHNIEAEKALIASAFWSYDSLQKVCEEVDKNVFYLDSHSKIFEVIQSLYYDTDNYLLIRRSIEKPMYKEKIRLRGYGEVNSDSKVFLEIKKKSDGIVYKRRVRLKEKEAVDFFYSDTPLDNGQIGNEINYFKQYYGSLE